MLSYLMISTTQLDVLSGESQITNHYSIVINQIHYIWKEQVK